MNNPSPDNRSGSGNAPIIWGARTLILSQSSPSDLEGTLAITGRDFGVMETFRSFTDAARHSRGSAGYDFVVVDFSSPSFAGLREDVSGLIGLLRESRAACFIALGSDAKSLEATMQAVLREIDAGPGFSCQIIQSKEADGNPLATASLPNARESSSRKRS